MNLVTWMSFVQNLKFGISLVVIVINSVILGDKFGYAWGQVQSFLKLDRFFKDEFSC